MRYQFVVTIFLLVVTLGTHAQNKYIPPDPYSIQGIKQHFSKYLITSPLYLGPNALPVPRLSNASVIKEFLFDIEYEQYQTAGEKTHDVFVQTAFPVAHGKASFVFYYVPYEFYQTDSVVSRNRRTATGKQLDGVAHGDVYFGARAQLIRDHDFLPDLVFGMYARTASGTKVEDARFTDTPGYYLDLSIGKTLKIRPDDWFNLRWYAVAGFYVWQTYLDDYPQDDAIYYGLGLDLQLKRIHWMNTLRGYSGYMNNGDLPLVYRSEMSLSEGLASLILGYEYGIRDYPFQGFRIGIRLNGLKDATRVEE